MNVESPMDGTVTHLFKGKRERGRRKERINIQQAFALELTKYGLQRIASLCTVELYRHSVFNNMELKISFSGLHTKTKRYMKGPVTFVVLVHIIYSISYVTFLPIVT